MTTSIGDLITQAEGFRAAVYCDRCGNRLLKAHSQIGKWECSIDCIGGNLTVGYGQRVDGAGVTMRQAAAMLEAAVSKIADRLSEYGWFARLNAARQAVLVDMAYCMGLDGVLRFTGTIEALKAGDYNAAANRMLISHWATNEWARAAKDAAIMRTGEMPVPQPKENL